MGIYDRDYYRDGPRRGGFGTFSMASITTWMIVINVGVFLIDSFLQQQRIRSLDPEVFANPAYRQYASRFVPGPLEEWGFFSVTSAVYHLQAWRFFTFQFLHANLAHLFSNMLSLYLFGPMVENYLGSRRYLGFYLLCGCSGAIVYLLLLMFGVLQGPNVPLVGASAGIFGVLVAGAILAPDARVMLLFPPIPIQLKYLALILVAWAAYTALTNGSNAGGQAAHLGGAILGYVLIRHPRVLRIFDGFRRGDRTRAGRGRAGFTDWSRNVDR